MCRLPRLGSRQKHYTICSTTASARQNRPPLPIRNLGSPADQTKDPTGAGSVSAAPPQRHAACPPEGLQDWSAAHASAAATGVPATHHVGATAFPARRGRSSAPGATRTPAAVAPVLARGEDDRIGVAISVRHVRSGKMQSTARVDYAAALWHGQTIAAAGSKPSTHSNACTRLSSPGKPCVSTSPRWEPGMYTCSCSSGQSAVGLARN